MRYLYICPRCKTVYSAESEVPSFDKRCVDCNEKLKYANCNKEEWDQKSESEKKEYKELDSIVKDDPELKKIIEKKLSEISGNKIKI